MKEDIKEVIFIGRGVAKTHQGIGRTDHSGLPRWRFNGYLRAKRRGVVHE